MKILDLSFASPEENLACDDALLEAAEEGLCGQLLRFWEPRQYFVVLGYSNQAAREINNDACRSHRIPVFRRISGGGTVLQGPGCLNYSLILQIEDSAGLSSIRSTNELVMNKHCQALLRLTGAEVSIKGITDLALGELKFSGNAQRRKKKSVLFHGAFLLNFDLSLMEKFLAMPSLQPAYRHDRKHSDFLANLNLDASLVKQSLAEIWEASGNAAFCWADKMEELIEKHYSRKEWNLKF